MSEVKKVRRNVAQKLDMMFRRERGGREAGEERVSLREISVSINARPGANELSLIDHWPGRGPG